MSCNEWKYSNSLREYKEQEIEFSHLVEDLGSIRPSSKYEDIYGHYDLKLNINGKLIYIDVKALKKIHRYDEKTDERYHYVEIRNVKGKLGWLYGKADWFAFETNDSYVVVDKLKLQELIATLCKDKVYSDKPELYKLYNRKGRKDLITLVYTKDLIDISIMIKKKR